MVEGVVQALRQAVAVHVCLYQQQKIVLKVINKKKKLDDLFNKEVYFWEYKQKH
jgi:hypothetical protein